MDIFLNGLTEDSIDRVIACFREAIKSWNQDDFDPGQAQKTCNNILRLTAEGSISMDMVRQLPKCWVNLKGLARQSNLNTLESCITRVFCIKSASTLHHWLLDIVPAAIKRNSHSTWIDKLVSDVRMAINGKKSKDFASDDYLPYLNHPKTFHFQYTSFRFEQTEILTSIVSSIIRVWLNFPADELSLVQLSIMDIITAKSPQSVMFLDKVWDAYSTPFATLFKKWNVKRSKSETEKKLKEFDEKYASHPFAIPDSLEYQKLKYLDQLIHSWTNKDKPVNDMVCQFL